MVTFRINLDGMNDMAREFAELNMAFPEFKGIMLQRFGKKMLSSFLSTYTLDLPLNNQDNHEHPTIYKNQIGNSTVILIDPSPRRNWVILSVRATHIAVVEAGRAPGPVDAVEADAIAEWARLKLGVTSDLVISRIIRKIERKGIYPRQLIADTFDPGTPRGNLLQQQLDAELEQALENMIGSFGLNARSG